MTINTTIKKYLDEVASRPGNQRQQDFDDLDAAIERLEKEKNPMIIMNLEDKIDKLSKKLHVKRIVKKTQDGTFY